MMPPDSGDILRHLMGIKWEVKLVWVWPLFQWLFEWETRLVYCIHDALSSTLRVSDTSGIENQSRDSSVHTFCNAGIDTFTTTNNKRILTLWGICIIGMFATDMGKLEEENGGFLLKFACKERMWKVEELGFAIATVADERNGYLAGVDILCDGGSTRGMKEFKKNKK